MKEEIKIIIRCDKCDKPAKPNLKKSNEDWKVDDEKKCKCGGTFKPTLTKNNMNKDKMLKISKEIRALIIWAKREIDLYNEFIFKCEESIKKLRKK